MSQLVLTPGNWWLVAAGSWWTLGNWYWVLSFHSLWRQSFEMLGWECPGRYLRIEMFQSSESCYCWLELNWK